MTATEPEAISAMIAAFQALSDEQKTSLRMEFGCDAMDADWRRVVMLYTIHTLRIRLLGAPLPTEGGK